MDNVVAVSAGSYHSLAVLSDNTVRAWGYNGLGQLGDNTIVNRTSPVQVTGPNGVGVLDNVIAVSAGIYHSLALLSDGTVRAWGYNANGQLGDNTLTNSSSPVQVAGPGGVGFLTNVVAVSAGGAHSLALLSDGTVRAWGSNWYGNLGDNTINDSSSPVQVAGFGGVGFLDNVIAVSAGEIHSLALLSDGTVRAWGHNANGQLGDNTLNNSSSPVQVAGSGGVGFLDNVIAVSAGVGHSLALLSNGTVRGWGHNANGQLGDNTLNNSSSPVQVAGPGGVGVLDNVVAVSAGGAHSLALLSDGTVRAWGYNGDGELGDGTIFDHAAPGAISSPGTVMPNGPPVADAGPDQAVSTGATVQLDGTGSDDPDGDPLTYWWYLYSPDGSSAVLSSATSPTPTFVADLPGDYYADLYVSDGKTISYAYVIITATDNTASPPPTGSWRETPNQGAGAPQGRNNHTAVWTGTEMIVWGGTGFNDGGRYDPVTDHWQPTALDNAPTGRWYPSAVWTGSRMIVWGGYNDSTGITNTGGRYDPATDTWQSTSTTGAPAGRQEHTVVWTGSEMIVWGGWVGSNPRFNDGGRYDPASDSWVPVSTVGAPSARVAHTAVWTGAEMIVFGGINSSVYLANGGRYSPSAGTWTPISAGMAMSGHSAVWTGTEMILWGGRASGYPYRTNDGIRYNPATNQWWAINGFVNRPTARYWHAAVWTGAEMVVWGGEDAAGAPSSGGRYNPITDSWQPTILDNAPAGRWSPSAVWTGARMIVWGGFNGSRFFNTGGQYDPTGDAWVPVQDGSFPGRKAEHTAVWTGTEMIVWGGDSGGGGRQPPPVIVSIRLRIPGSRSPLPAHLQHGIDTSSCGPERS